MHSWEIVKWQDNIAEDIAKDKLQLNENLLNGILELSLQIAQLREDTVPKVSQRIIDITREALNQPLPAFEIRVFGLRVFVVKPIPTYSDILRVRSGYRGAVRLQIRKLKSLFGCE